jgi:hypothetical protein
MDDELIGFVAVILAAPVWAFCFVGSKSAKNQIADLQKRVAQLEAAAGSSKSDSDS